MIGIYKITNLINYKVYIGQSKNIEKRFKLHKYKLNKNIHFNYHLQKAWNKYGFKNFSFDVIEITENNLKVLNDRETYWCNFYKPNVYNLGHTGNVGTFSEETKKKMSLHNNRYWLGKHPSEETKRKISESSKWRKSKYKGIPRSKETRRKISLSSKGKKMSLESRKKMSKSHSGKKLSLEHRKHLSESQKGRLVSEETRKKISIANTGKHRILTEKEKHRLRTMNIGRKMSEHARQLLIDRNHRMREHYRECNLGRIFITNGVDDKMIKKEELDKYISLGYKIGRTKTRCYQKQN